MKFFAARPLWVCCACAPVLPPPCASGAALQQKHLLYKERTILLCAIRVVSMTIMINMAKMTMMMRWPATVFEFLSVCESVACSSVTSSIKTEDRENHVTLLFHHDLGGQRWQSCLKRQSSIHLTTMFLFLHMYLFMTMMMTIWWTTRHIAHLWHPNQCQLKHSKGARSIQGGHRLTSLKGGAPLLPLLILLLALL